VKRKCGIAPYYLCRFIIFIQWIIVACYVDTQVTIVVISADILSGYQSLCAGETGPYLEVTTANTQPVPGLFRHPPRMPLQLPFGQIYGTVTAVMVG
jgi:hypothetical protein